MVLDAAEERGLDAGRLDARPLAVAPEAREVFSLRGGVSPAENWFEVL